MSPTLVNGETPFHSQVSPASSKVGKILETTETEVRIESIEHDLSPVEEEPKIRVHVDRDVRVDADGEEIKHTKVEVELPLLGELPSPEEAAKMVAEAKAMVEAALEADKEADSALAGAKSKRKADDIAQDEEDKEGEEGASPQAKKVKTEAELRKEKIRKRAFFGLTATVAVGAFG